MHDLNEKDKNTLKNIIWSVRNKEDIKKVKKEFNQLISRITPEELAVIEQELLKEGVEILELQKLSEIHISLFHKSLIKNKKLQIDASHPISILLKENVYYCKLLKILIKESKQAKLSGKSNNLKSFFKLKQILTHYTIIQKYIFSNLELVNFFGPSKIMAAKHQEIKERIENFDNSRTEGKYKELLKLSKELSSKINKLIFMENNILFPISIKKIPKKIWDNMYFDTDK